MTTTPCLKRIAALALLLLLPLVAGGCSVHSGEKQIFPICMSLDKLPDGRIQLAVQVSSMAPEGGYAVFSAAGDSFEQALEILGASMPYPLHFGQLRLCLLGWTPAAEGELRTLLEPVGRLSTISPNAYLFAAMGNAAEIMEAQQPDLGVRLSTYLDQLLTRLRQEKLTPPETLHDVLHMLSSSYGDPLLGLCALNRQATEKTDASGSSGEQTGGAAGGAASGGDAQPAFRQSGSIAIGEPSPGSDLPAALSAGDLPRRGGNPVEYTGCAAVGGGRITGILTAAETHLVLTLREQTTVTQISDNGATIAIPQGINLDTAARLVTKLQSLNCDALRLGAAEAKQYNTSKNWLDAIRVRGFSTMHLTITWK